MKAEDAWAQIVEEMNGLAEKRGWSPVGEAGVRKAIRDMRKYANDTG
jgi:hypothetical protein